ncbi:hypothetical protein HK100_008315 [Physocladia obscura]|uniref:Uncharacterized protein n=1 Tax=Physocladia obscura TaxID=109957 RepID=A0AAD5XAM6_9FUNG|nr:hypothetical protein HK100_008315 [Physocladia obscura]
MPLKLESLTASGTLAEANRAMELLHKMQAKLGQIASSAKKVIHQEEENSGYHLCYMCAIKCPPQFGGVDGRTPKIPLCKQCESFNASKLEFLPDLSLLPGAVIVTGARIKVGYAVALRLIDANVPLIILTTRFPFLLADALLRDRPKLSENSISERVSTKVHIYGADFRSPNSVANLTNHWATWYPSISMIINNAAQTIRRPAAFYKPIVEIEQQIFRRNDLNLASMVKQLQQDPFQIVQTEAVATISNAFDALLHITDVTESSLFTQLQVLPIDFQPFNTSIFPPVFAVDSTAQRPDPSTGELVQDLRVSNSWTQTFTETHPLEALETLVINAWAPFTILHVLMSRLCADAVVVNVTSRKEGAADRQAKDGGVHTHSNMAKSALEAMTRSVAADIAATTREGVGGVIARGSGVVVCAVDPGWVSTFAVGNGKKNNEAFSLNEEDGSIQVGKMRKIPPLSCEDAAARVLDPLIQKFCGNYVPNGVLFRNYSVVKGWD